jgi:hypothetical protein
MILHDWERRLDARGSVMCMPYAAWKSRPSLRPSHIPALRRAASNMTGAKRRAFEAEMTLKDCAGTPLMAATIVGWGRQTVALGLAEQRTGMSCLGAPSAFRGRKRWEEQHPQAAQALRQLADAQAPQAPTFRTRLPSTRLTAQAAVPALRAQGESAAPRPSPSTMAEVLHRLGVRLRRVGKAKPQKQRKETAALCDTMNKKRLKPCQRQASHDGVSLGKRRGRAVSSPVGGAPVAPTEPVLTLGDARQKRSLVGSSMQRVARWPCPLAAPIKRVTASGR